MANLRSMADWNWGPRNSSISAGEMAADVEFGRRMRAGAGHLRIIGDHLAESLGAQEMRHDDIFVGLALQRGALQRFEIAIGHIGVLSGRVIAELETAGTGPAARPETPCPPPP